MAFKVPSAQCDETTSHELSHTPNDNDNSSQVDTPPRRDIKFALHKRKRNLVSASNSILVTGKDESDDETDEMLSDGKRKRIALLENGKLTEREENKKPRNCLVIPMVTQNDWRTQRLLKLENERKLEFLTENSSPSIQEESSKTGDQFSESVSSVDPDYDLMPIESFGLAVLRGCGWHEGEGIGKTNKRVVPLRVSSRRPKGLGLGADVGVSAPTSTGTNGIAGKLGNLKKSSLVKITGGIHRDLYGKIESFDEDNASVIVQLALNGKNVRVSLYAVHPVTAKEYERKSKNFAEQCSGDKHLAQKSHFESNKIKMLEKDCKVQKFQTDRLFRKEIWTQPELKVRFINKKFKDGKLFNEKVRILDVADRENCTVEDSSGNIYYQISESWLETVIPKVRGEKLMIVSGPRRGNVAMLEERDKKKQKAVVRLLVTDEIVTLSFDDVCEYLGSIDDL